MRSRLEKGEYSVGDLFFSLQEVCDTYHISEITARRVFQELKQAGWINPVRKKGTVVTRHAKPSEVIYVTHANVLSGENLDPLAWWASYNLFLEGLKLKQDFHNVRVSAIGHTFFFSHLDEFKNKDVVMSQEFFKWLPVDRANHREIIDLLRTTIRPIITRANDDITEGFTCIKADYRKGAITVVNHLLGKGHTRVACITGDVNYLFFHHQFHGYLDTLRSAAIPVDFKLIKNTNGTERAQDWRAMEELLALPDPPTAVVCCNDSRALHVLEYCARKKIKVPGCLAVTGCDNREETRFSRPPLTTVDPLFREQGEKALELIMKRAAGELKEPTVVTMEPELVVRKST